MDNGTQDRDDGAGLAMLIEAIASRGDPLTRFVASLPDELRRFAEETMRMREELIHHTHGLLSSEPREATAHAEWLTRHAHDVAYRWSNLRKSAIRWATLDTEAMTFRVTTTDRLPRGGA